MIKVFDMKIDVTTCHAMYCNDDRDRDHSSLGLLVDSSNGFWVFRSAGPRGRVVREGTVVSHWIRGIRRGNEENEEV